MCENNKKVLGALLFDSHIKRIIELN